jgi:chemotaxis-related protein WspD
VNGDCWNSIGVHGDRTCSELVQHVHCRNCPVYARAAASLLQRISPDGYIAEWTRHAAHPETPAEPDRRSVLIFRVGTEWLALPSPVVIEVSEQRPIRSLPHRRKGTMLGLVSVRGELLVCMSLARALGLAAAAGERRQGHLVHARMLVLRRNEARVVCAVDEVHGLHAFPGQALRDVPATVAKGATTHAKAVLTWQERSVGILDDQSLFQTFQRSLA